MLKQIFGTVLLFCLLILPIAIIIYFGGIKWLEVGAIVFVIGMAFVAYLALIGWVSNLIGKGK